MDILIRQAERWLGLERFDLAASSIERALAAEPRNTQALAVAARIEAARGNRTAAAGITARLREAGGTEEQRATAETALRAASIDRNAIEEARRLARDGRNEEAAARYRQIFGAAGPPPAYQQEYFSVIAGTRAGAEEGRRGLARLAESPGATPRARLNFAQTQTFQPGTRQDGIRRLAPLVNDPEVGEEARRAWRQALLWSAAEPGYAPLVQAYLQRYPNDTELRQAQQAALAAAPRPDPGATLRQEGFQRLEAGGTAGLRESSRQFEAALAANPRDADALGGLGIVRLRENRPAEARQLLERAVAADPSRAAQWQSALDGAAYGLELAEARTALRRNDVDAADNIARSAARRSVEDRTDAEVLLGQVALRRGDPAAAEQRFRTALSRRPGFAPAREGLAQALRAQGRLAELPRIAGAAPPPGEGGPAPSAGPVNQLRSEASRSTDPFVAEALLRQAMTSAPNDPWLRLDLARALRRQGQLVQARTVLEELVVRDPRPDSLFAAALFADEEGRIADADAFLNRIPPASRSPDMSRLQARIRTQRDVQRAAQGLGRSTADARVQLLTIAARPDPTGSTAAAVIRAFGDANDRFGAAEAARVGEAANRMAGPQARLAIAGALLGAGLDGEAAALADQLDGTGTLTAEQRRDVASLRAGIAVRSSDRLNAEGNQAQAFERLRPTLDRDPENTDANLALARLYQGAREPREAQRIAEAMLARNPRNFDARQGAIDAALTLRQRSRAEALLAEGQEIFPRESRMSLLEARVARTFNQDDRARRALETAAAQRRAELGQVAGVPAGVATAGPGGQPNPFLRPGAASPLPVVAGGTPQPTDRLSREIAQEMASLEEQTAPRVTLAGTLRQRSGSSGLDRLLDLRAPLEAEFTPPLIGGRVTTNVTAISLDSGTLGTNANTQQRFGTGSLYNAVQNPRSTAAGVGLGMTYRRGDSFRFDVGSSPLGFPTSTMLGGVELAPQIGTARIRLTGERRSVEDSLLSWAGQRDQFSGRNWGNVVRTGGRAQIELPLGPGYVYAGGGYSVFEGQNVASNARIEGGAGFSYPIIRGASGDLSVGTDLVYFAYDRNQSQFTYGSGGYFSPQAYTAFNVPVDFRGRSGDFTYRLGATAGYAVFRQEATPYFPNDPALQRQLVARAATSTTPLLTGVPTQNQQNFVGGLRADMDYAITPRINLGAGFRYDKAADWDETRVFIRLQSRF
ncbi:cellulose synthase subunit BcsC-related outer membrane protein [Sediminicoccus sp. KRV36]|uniref:cellulose synthase subunit BcsC-related outer membrane protein n=1 Tax=Sediminicoccus sp. KRV36 TaxID=3133721 RepID=UPI00200BF096|nr:cellulose synthase subunit BcsC-related outer membrane protein [Sediminicoccus rosea]UPY37751.1 BCSC C-terminal domain-containing protein [Sediminicoccus rosea]